MTIAAIDLSDMSDDKVNEACAEVLGWRRTSLQGDGRDLFENPSGDIEAVPDFCGDWNKVSTLWFFITCKGSDVMSEFERYFQHSLSFAIISSPRVHAEGFLVALGKAEE